MANHDLLRTQRPRGDGRRVLAILSAIAAGDRLIQRELARELGVAVSLVNLAIQRLAHQGLVRVESSHPTRLRYFLTAKGIQEMARLTHARLESSFAEYRDLRDRVRRILQPHLESGARRFAIWGAGNAAEIAYVCLMDSGLDEITVFAGDGEKTFLGRPIRAAGDLVSEDFDRNRGGVARFRRGGGWALRRPGEPRSAAR